MRNSYFLQIRAAPLPEFYSATSPISNPPKKRVVGYFEKRLFSRMAGMVSWRHGQTQEKTQGRCQPDRLQHCSGRNPVV
jgi:hypothetical protein